MAPQLLSHPNHVMHENTIIVLELHNQMAAGFLKYHLTNTVNQWSKSSLPENQHTKAFQDLQIIICSCNSTREFVYSCGWVLHHYNHIHQPYFQHQWCCFSMFMNKGFQTNSCKWYMFAEHGECYQRATELKSSPGKSSGFLDTWLIF